MITSKEHFEIGDWFYLDSGAAPAKIISQEVINIKLGIKSKLPKADYLYKIIEIQGSKLYYNNNQVIRNENTLYMSE